MHKEKQKVYTSKIIKSPTLLNDTKLFLSHWDEGLSVDENIKRAVEENIFGMPARAYIKQSVAAFSERYIFGDERDRALRKLVRKCHNNAVVHKIEIIFI